MSNFFNNDTEKQIYYIAQTANKIGLPPQAIEKDLWVTNLLQIVFSLPFAGKLVFKGGTSLSKIWGVIKRFSEDIDLAIDRELFDLQGDLTIRQLKKLRKLSSNFVKKDFCEMLQNSVNQHGISELCTIEPQPDGEGDKTYPEPRKIHIHYRSLFGSLPYLKSEIVLEIGARSLIEPAATSEIKSLISENFDIDTSLVSSEIITALPEKTFLEKAFLLHEIFTADASMLADRKSRHLYDLERMMDKDFALKAVKDNELWNIIHHHREIFTHVRNMNYSVDIRKNICLIPPRKIIADWRQDYQKMQTTMIYGDSLPFEKLMENLQKLQRRFHNLIV
jgi:hypothetical protein